MILQIFKIKNMAKEVKENPGKFAGGQMGDLFVGMFILPAFLTLISLGGLFILGYTTLLGGPYGFFKFLFLLSLFGIFCVLYFLRKIYLMVKNVAKNVVDETINVESKVIE